MNPRTVLSPVGAPGANAKRGVVRHVAFADALPQSNAAVRTNKAVIIVNVSWRIIFIILLPKLMLRSWPRPSESH